MTTTVTEDAIIETATAITMTGTITTAIAGTDNDPWREVRSVPAATGVLSIDR